MAGDLRDGGVFPAAGAGGRRLVGREAETGVLRAALADLASGVGRAIALVGEPGIGKSALMAASAAQARAAAVPVRAARGPGGIDSVLPGVGTGVGPGVVVTVDDLHQLPAEQIPLAERLIETAAAEPVLCLLAYRQRQLPPALAAVLSRAASAGLLDVWNLGPLTAEECWELLGDRDRAQGAQDADALYREAMGNPQYLKILAGRGDAGADAGIAVLGEIADLDHGPLAAVQAAAVLGEHFHPELLAEVADLDSAETLRVLDLLTRLDLVRQTEPARLVLRHRAVGEVVYQRLEPSRRIALHQRAEAALAQRMAPIARRARHVAQAADPSRPEHVTTLIAAARDSLYASPAMAAEHLQAALPLLKEGDAHWHEAHVLLARTRLLTGDAIESRELLDVLRAALPGGPAANKVRALVDSSRAERRLGRYTEAGAIARSALEVLADSDIATAAAVHSELSDHAYDIQDYETSRQHAETAAEIARRHDDPAGEANALAQAAVAHLFAADQTTALERTTRAAGLIDAAADSTLLTNLESTFQLGLTEGMLGRLVDSERHLQRGAALSRRTGQTYIEPQILTTLANTQLRAGNLRGALVTLDATARHADRAGNPPTRAIIAMLRAEVLFWLNGPDELGEAVSFAEQAIVIAGDDPTTWAVTVRCFNAELLLLAGYTARARWQLLDAAGGSDLPRITVWRRPRWCDTLALAAWYDGDKAGVEHWAGLAEECVSQLPSVGRQGFAHRARMRAHSLHGDTDRAVASAREAIAGFTAGGERIEASRTLLAAAELHLDAGRTAEVDGWLDRVAILTAQSESKRVAEELAHQRGRFAALSAPGDAVPAALAVLTAREREIAVLASTGKTSGEIAEELFLSVRTVDGHLGRVYRKLDVSNRAGLAHVVLHGEAPDAPDAPGAPGVPDASGASDASGADQG
jgi:DNA-binding CsgD family transcriptional regulator